MFGRRGLGVKQKKYLIRGLLVVLLGASYLVLTQLAVAYNTPVPKVSSLCEVGSSQEVAIEMGAELGWTWVINPGSLQLPITQGPEIWRLAPGSYSYSFTNNYQDKLGHGSFVIRSC